MMDECKTEEMTIELLRRIDFLDSLRIEDLEYLSQIVEVQFVDTGDVIFSQGDPPDAFYIIERGTVEIILEYHGRSEVVTRLSRASDFFGEMGLIEDKPRSATARAASKTRLLVLSRQVFDQLINTYPEVHREITRVLSHGLRQSDSFFVEKILEKNQQLAEAYQNLKQAQEELLRRERLSLVGKLASGIIHDLKKPMTCISGYAQLLGGKTVVEEKRYRYSEKITHEVHRLVDMVNEILQFARGEQKIVRSKVNMTEWLDDVVELMRRDFEESRVKFNKTLNYDGEIYVDYEKFKSVFFNIAANAITAMPEGGNFTFKSSQKDKQVRLDFIDTGVGMGDEAKAHVFEDFFSQAKDGTGLGMAIVRRIVEAHEGTISLESELGKGTKFTILLPTDRK